MEGTYTFTVMDVSKEGCIYDPSENELEDLTVEFTYPPSS